MTYTEKALKTEAIIKDFFLKYDANSIKNEFWQCFVAAISSDEFINWTPVERVNLTTLFTDLTEFLSELEVIHLKKTV